jgi:hypothetical protein
MNINAISKKQFKHEQLIIKFCQNDDLATYDPYDIWKTKAGLKVKSLFYANSFLGVMPAFIFSFWDLFINNNLRIGYNKQEFPIVRALAAKSLLNIYEISGDPNHLYWAKHHLDWLIANYSHGYSGFCWGANMQWASKNGVYSSNTPFITNTPYVLEGLIQYQKATNNDYYQRVIRSIYDFIKNDLYKHIDEVDILSLSYAPIHEPRTVINANAYALYSLSLLHSFFPEKSESIQNDVLRLFRFININQNSDGSWWYYADNKKGNFIDCFHTCFILKNLIKSSSYLSLPSNLNNIIDKGYKYLIDNFYEKDFGLFKRFSKTDKLNLIKFDLYDNAEMLNLAHLIKDKDLVKSLERNIQKLFFKNNDLFSVIDLFNCRRNRNMLRWAVMPYIHALSHTEILSTFK